MTETRKNYIALSESNTEKRSGETWLEILNRWLVRCPQCLEVWLVVGAREKDRYVCKDCGHEFVIRFATEPKSTSDEEKRTAA